MPLLATSHLPYSNKDMLSFCHENRGSYDGDRPMYIDCANPNRFITANQAWRLIRRLVAGFRALGIREGECVCVNMLNHIYYPLLVQGIVGAGGVFTGANPGYTTRELRHALAVSKARVVITEREFLGNVREATSTLGMGGEVRILVFDDDDDDDDDKDKDIGPYRSWRHLLKHGEEDWISFDDEERSKSTTAWLLFSSGTTGLPKAVQTSHHNIVSGHTMIHERPGSIPPYDQRRIFPTPPFHVGTAPFLHVSTLRLGWQAFIMRRFDLLPYLENMARFSINDIVVYPPLVVAILAQARSDPDLVKASFQSLRRGICGAAPLDKASMNAFQTLLPPDCQFTNGFGMSESTGPSCLIYWPEKETTASIGRFPPDIDVKILDDEGKEIGPWNVRGELCLRGPNVSKGYLDNPVANRQDWDDDGFFHTGDIVWGEEETGKWYVVDRKKELIKVRAFQVAPAEIEGVLLEHEDIVDAGVIGVPSETSGEVPKALVVRATGSQLNQEKVKAWIQGRLAKYKQLEGGVEFVTAIPKSPSGKILRKDLRARELERSKGKSSKL